jgi:hypothetical protein
MTLVLPTPTPLLRIPADDLVPHTQPPLVQHSDAAIASEGEAEEDLVEHAVFGQEVDGGLDVPGRRGGHAPLLVDLLLSQARQVLAWQRDKTKGLGLSAGVWEKGFRPSKRGDGMERVRSPRQARAKRHLLKAA